MTIAVGADLCVCPALTSPCKIENNYKQRVSDSKQKFCLLIMFFMSQTLGMLLSILARPDESVRTGVALLYDWIFIERHIISVIE